jgi:hypothetical protein
MNAASGMLLLAVALAAANAPFLSRRILMLVKPADFDSGKDKHGGWRVLELVLLYWVVLGLGRVLEAHVGEVYSQNWEFYAITASLFLVFAYPGFVYRYLRKSGTNERG